MDDPEIRREEGDTKGRWVVEVEGRLAEMTYSKASPTLIIIDHTEVDDALRGRGLARALVGAAVEAARREHFKIIPLCPIAKAVLEKTTAWGDVLKQ